MKLEEKIEKLNRIGMALSSIHGLDELLELIVSEARDLTRSDAGSLYLRDGEELYFRVSQNSTLEKRLGSRKSFFKPFKIPISKSAIAGYVTVTAKALNIEDAYNIQTDRDYKHSKEFDEKFSYRTKSILTVPLIVLGKRIFDEKEEVIGVLQLINPVDESGNIVFFSNEDEDLVMSLASQASIAVNNAKFIDEIKDLFRAVIQYSASAIDARSPHTAGHSERVATLAHRLALAINEDDTGLFSRTEFSESQLDEIRYAGWLHDIGKIGIKEIVFDKRNKVSDETLENISYRFYSLLNEKYLKFLEKKIDIIESKKEEKNSNLVNLLGEFENEKRELTEKLNFIKRINIPTEKMQDSDVAKLMEFRSIAFTDPVNQEKIPVINEGDFENLSVLRGSLNKTERLEVQSHVDKSIKILEKVPFKNYLKNIPDIVAKHHECLDGSGYPKGVRADEISIQSRILCVCDIFDALVAKDRPYKPAMPIETAFIILRKDAKAGKLDEKLVELFIKKKIYTGVYPHISL